MPGSSTLCRRQTTLKVTIPCRGSQGPLHLLVDSTGIKAMGEGEWNARKHGGSKRRVWRKIHIGIDETTLEIRAAEFTSSDVGDAPMLPELLKQIPPDQPIASVTADGAFDTRKCHDAIAQRGAAAIIPPRRNAKPWTPDRSGAIARNEALRASKRFGRTIWRRWSGYHRRQPRRDNDPLREAAGPAPGREGLPASGRRVPGPCCRPERLHCPRPTRHRIRGVSLSGERGGPSVRQFAQQSHCR